MATQPPAAAKKNMIAKTHGSRLPLVTWPMVVSPRAWRTGANGLDPGIEHEDGEEDEGGPRDRARDEVQRPHPGADAVLAGMQQRRDGEHPDSSQRYGDRAGTERRG